MEFHSAGAHKQREPLRVALIATHPVQYQVPWLQRLSACEGLDLTVYYGLLPDARQQGAGFGIPFAWDIPLLDGYKWETLPSRVRCPGLNNFPGLRVSGVAARLARSKPDAVILTGWHSLSLLQALWTCVRLGIPRMVRGDSNGMRPRPFWTGHLHRSLLPLYDAFLTVGRANTEFYRSYGVAAERIFPCSHFVDNGRFALQAAREAERRQQLRASWSIDPGETCFLFAGKLQPRKRIMDLLAALQLLHGRAASIRLLVVGEGEQMAQARAFALEHNLPASFAGFLNQTEISKAYAAADCLVLPSDFGETWGLVVNEAMASGLPAIVSDRVGCGPDLVEEGVTGAVFPCRDVSALAARLAQLAADPRRLAWMGARARERVRDYSVERAVEGTLAALSYVTGRRS